MNRIIGILLIGHLASLLVIYPGFYSRGNSSGQVRMCCVLHGSDGPVAIDCVPSAMIESPDTTTQPSGDANLVF